MSPICGPEVFIHAYREMLEVESWETSYPTLGGTSKNISILLFRFSWMYQQSNYVTRDAHGKISISYSRNIPLNELTSTQYTLSILKLLQSELIRTLQEASYLHQLHNTSIYTYPKGYSSNTFAREQLIRLSSWRAFSHGRQCRAGISITTDCFGRPSFSERKLCGRCCPGLHTGHWTWADPEHNWLSWMATTNTKIESHINGRFLPEFPDSNPSVSSWSGQL